MVIPSNSERHSSFAVCMTRLFLPLTNQRSCLYMMKSSRRPRLFAFYTITSHCARDSQDRRLCVRVNNAKVLKKCKVGMFSTCLRVFYSPETCSQVNYLTLRMHKQVVLYYQAWINGKSEGLYQDRHSGYKRCCCCA